MCLLLTSPRLSRSQTPIPGHARLATGSLLSMSSVRANGIWESGDMCVLYWALKRVWARKLDCAIGELGNSREQWEGGCESGRVFLSGCFPQRWRGTLSDLPSWTRPELRELLTYPWLGLSYNPWCSQNLTTIHRFNMSTSLRTKSTSSTSFPPMLAFCRCLLVF